MGIPVAPRNIFPVQHPGPADLVRGAHLRSRPSRRARRHRPHGRDEPADLGQGRRRHRARRLSALRLRPSRCRSRNSATTSPSSACRSPRSAIANTPIRASASCSRTSSMSARSRRCSTWTWPTIEKLIGEQFKGKEKLFDANKHALHLGRDWALMNLDMPDRPAAQARQRGRRPHLHRRQLRRRARRRLWRRDGVRLVSDHAVVLARRGLHPPLPAAARRSGRPRRTSSPSSRPRTSSPRSAS